MIDHHHDIDNSERGDLVLAEKQDFCSWINAILPFVYKQEACCNKLIDISALVFGVLEPLPYIKSAVKFAGGNLPLEIIYGISEEIGGSLITILILQEVILYIRLEMLNSNARKNKLKFLLPLILGLISAIPATIVGLIYNQSVKAVAFFAFSGDFIANTFTIQHILTHWYYMLKMNPFERRWLNTFYSRVHLGQLSIATAPSQFTQEFIVKYRLNQCDVALGIEESSSLLIELYQIGSQIMEFRTAKVGNSNLLSWFNLLLSLLLPMFWLIANSYLTFSHIYSYLKISWLAGSIAVIGPSFVYLIDVIFLIKIFSNLNEFFTQLYCREKVTIYAFQKNKTLFLVMQFLALTAGSLSFTSRAQVIEDELSGFWQSLILPVASIVTQLMRFYSISRKVNSSIELRSRRSLDTAIAENGKIALLLELLDKRISTSSQEDVRSFLADSQLNDVVSKDIPPPKRKCSFFSLFFYHTEVLDHFGDDVELMHRVIEPPT